VTTVERARDRGTLRGERWLQSIANEFRSARLTLGLSQRRVAAAARIPRTTYGEIERAKYPDLTIVLAARVAALLGLDLVVALYAGVRSLRDEISARMTARVITTAGPPLRYRTEVPLRRKTERPEQRTWDLVFLEGKKRGAFEFESRLHDVQEQRRRHNLKREDDPVDTFVLVIADTDRNRRVLREFPELFADLPRLRTATVLNELKAGRLPPTGLMLLESGVKRPRRTQAVDPGVSPPATTGGDSAESA
jgi:transcriptional regulator with XRE-family HTH domain